MEPVYNIRAPLLDVQRRYRFEYHPRTKKVYWIVPPTDEERIAAMARDEQPKAQAWVIAEHVETEGQAFGAVQTWCRGYREGQKNPADGLVIPGAVY